MTKRALRTLLVMEQRIKTPKWKDLSPRKKAKRCRLYAQKARALAQASDSETEHALMRIAQSWLRLAEDLERASLAKSCRIALVDDDEMVRIALCRLLAIEGHRVDAFATADEFLAAAAKSAARCVVLDVNLGDASGLDVARRLAEIGFRRPVIFMTGSSDEQIRRQCLDRGCVAFLQKPVTKPDLIAAIADALRVRDDPFVSVGDLAGVLEDLDLDAKNAGGAIVGGCS